MGGSAGPGASWQYGRLEVINRGFLTAVTENTRDNRAIGRRGVTVACRSLGFPTGAQLLAGGSTALPGRAEFAAGISRIFCRGDEETLTACTLFEDVGPFRDYASLVDDSVAIMCMTPSGTMHAVRAMHALCSRPCWRGNTTTCKGV